ncbi:MAG: hypothetical protein V7707_19005 [Motiliproteus sp.]
MMSKNKSEQHPSQEKYETVTVSFTGAGVAEVSSDKIIRSEEGKKQLKALESIKAMHHYA